MASPMEIASLLQRPRGIQEWWNEVEESMHFARARPDFQKNVQKLVTTATFTVLVLFAGALLLLRHAPLTGEQILVKVGPEEYGPTEDWPPFVEERIQRPDWSGRHQRLVQEAKNGEFDLLYLGDSITEGWVGTSVDRPMEKYEGNKQTWDELNRELGVSAADFGIAGDRVLHLLWRMQNGELPARTPKVLILCIGVNDLGSGQSVDDTFEHMKRLLGFFETRTPEMGIALLSVLPSAYGVPTGARHEGPGQLNKKLKKLDGGRIRFIDCTSVFSEGDGVKNELFLPDFLHLNGDGYRRWALCFKDDVRKLLKKHSRRRLR
ncbi:1-alkyl-2-acetylglycerophosphocholine esterase [Klebsormidium nitens]|uniref:1-alkyl-2-acetylglycerophosphocholine esterase n=1 Tax=Klebsormidium nitens TaxID=105231 RepID=A0A1Y1I182_KLENI|nr:1-alkyl-2-acetylglycerophosphocholine esterase [Klebsormidium nitens]|eukprot:GAQ83712.1 1-alkyl-2-acetylglycerophosphocholine esterase [Klebsormidium nitens]